MRVHSISSAKRFRRYISVFTVVVICIAMLPFDAFAEGEEQPQADPVQPVQEVQPVAPRTAAAFSWNGYNLQFISSEVLIDSPLDANSEPRDDKAKKKGKKWKISWKRAAVPDSVDGYIILRRKGKSKVYTELVRLGADRRKYTDKSAKKGKYYYTIVGFRQEGAAIRISACAGLGRSGDRKYQNPRKYVQITDKISTHGRGYYTSPVLINGNSSKKQHIDAMIDTAYMYLGDPYRVCQSGETGKGVDCSGLVMQACYGAGVDLWPSNPYRHRFLKYEYESRYIAKNKKLKTVKYSKRKRGDLIFFCNSLGTIIHVAIYLGNNQIIHSNSVDGRVVVSGMGAGAYGRPCKVKRIFN